MKLTVKKKTLRYDGRDFPYTIQIVDYPTYSVFCFSLGTKKRIGLKIHSSQYTEKEATKIWANHVRTLFKHVPTPTTISTKGT